jgi:hypothetical protein
LDDIYGNAVGRKPRRAACFSLAALSMQRVEDPYDARQEIGTAAGTTAAAKSRSEEKSIMNEYDCPSVYRPKAEDFMSPA